MNSEFSRIISLLRKERNISQKQAAADLGVSQALLSHYEKGIRECGLDFIVKAADYYNVSCDYLLGRSPEPGGKMIQPAGAQPQREKQSSRTKKILYDSVDLLTELAAKTGNDLILRSVSDYLLLCVYKVFRIIYSSNPRNDRRLFRISDTESDGLTNAAICLCGARISSAAEQTVSEHEETGTEEPVITAGSLSENYPDQATSLLSAVKESEDYILSISSADPMMQSSPK